MDSNRKSNSIRPKLRCNRENNRDTSMNEMTRRAWACAICNADFICIETFSGYVSGRRDPKGKQHLLPPDASDEILGLAILDALEHSRFVLGAPRTDVWIHPDVEYDTSLYDYKQGIERYAAW